MKHIKRYKIFESNLSNDVEIINEVFTVEVGDDFNLSRLTYDQYEGETENTKSNNPSVYYIDYYSDFIRIKISMSDENASVFKNTNLKSFDTRLGDIGFKIESTQYYYGIIGGSYTYNQQLIVSRQKKRRRNFAEITLIIIPLS